MTANNISKAISDLSESIQDKCIIFSQVEIDTDTCKNEKFIAPGYGRKRLLESRCENEFNNSELEKMHFVCRVNTYAFGSVYGEKRNANIDELDNMEIAFDDLNKNEKLSLIATDIFRFDFEVVKEYQDEDEFEM